jgi:preprotein translocase subunit SecB
MMGPIDFAQLYMSRKQAGASAEGAAEEQASEEASANGANGQG